jgi:hypothetical protein
MAAAEWVDHRDTESQTHGKNARQKCRSESPTTVSQSCQV